MFWITGGTGFFLAVAGVAAPGLTQFLRVQFDHAGWNGFTFYDLIFPLFIFISGLSIPFSITRRIERGEDKATLYKHLAVRTAVLVLLGMLHNGPHLVPFGIRITGVLQRIAICSGVASVIAMNSRVRTQAYVVGGILLGYWALLAFTPVPHFAAGDYSAAGNLAGYVDRLLLPFPRTWCCYPFGDSEGIVSTLPAVATALLGVLAGHLLRADVRPIDRVWWLLVAGAACVVAGLAWDVVFPINKELWTSSYVLYAGGWSLLLLAAAYWTLDVKGLVGWSFLFRVIGANAIVMYFLESVLRFGFLKGMLGASAGFGLLIASLDLFVRWGLVYALYRKRWFFKV